MDNTTFTNNIVRFQPALSTKQLNEIKAAAEVADNHSEIIENGLRQNNNLTKKPSAGQLSIGTNYLSSLNQHRLARAEKSPISELIEELIYTLDLGIPNIATVQDLETYLEVNANEYNRLKRLTLPVENVLTHAFS